jgi:hypothetical protein
MRRRRPVLVLAAAACASAAACYGPTEVRLEISTDLPCRAVADGGGAAAAPVHTVVRLGGAVDSAIVADTRTCSAGVAGDPVADIGSIVLVPSGDRSAHVTVQVTATADGSDPDLCGRPGTPVAAQAQCIVARRTFAFIKHTSRSLPIRLYASCKGQVCDASQTCNQSGTCESAAVNDDTGCLASEPGCNGGAPGPVAPPDVDASDSGDSGDAATVDASDASPSLPCTAADGTNVITTGAASDRVAANSTRLFWISGDGSSDTIIPVMAADTKIPGPPALLFNLVPTVGSTITGFAADDRAVWIATQTNAYRYDLGTNALLTFNLSGIKDIASSTARDAAGAMVTTKAYAVTAGALLGDPSGVGGAIYELSANGFDIVHAGPGTRIAAANLSVPMLFVFTPRANNGPAISRGLPNAAQFDKLYVDDSVVALATDDHDVFFSTASTIARVNAGSNQTTTVFDIKGAGLVAVDTTSVFFEAKGAPSSIFRGIKNPLNAGIFTLAPQLVATGYADVAGLAIDDACVYFWGTPTGGVATLNVYPKTRTVLSPTPAPAAIKAPRTP